MKDELQQEPGSHRARKMMVWLGVGSIAMFFAAFTSAYIVLQADHYWVQNELPQAFTISTVLILISSITIYLANRSLAQGKMGQVKNWLLLTLLLGAGFTATQYMGWSALQDEGKFFLGKLGNLKGEYGVDYVIMSKGEALLYDDGNYYKPGDISYSEPINERIENTFNVSSSLLYILSGFHVLHLLGGIIWLLVLVYKAISGKINATNTLPLQLGSIYWHFLDILWIYLFLFLLFIR